jgi:hypothetical protein
VFLQLWILWGGQVDWNKRYLRAFPRHATGSSQWTTGHGAEKNGKQWLTMNATKDGLKGAVGYKYDRSKATWVRA